MATTEAETRETMHTPITMGKTYRTRDGREVRIYAVDGDPKAGCPVHGAINGLRDGYVCGWWATSWTEDGTWQNTSPGGSADLIEVKPKITRTYWFCHTANENDCSGFGWTDKAEAEKWARQVNREVSLTGPHEITFTPGEGL